MPSAAAWVSSLDRAVRAKVAWPHPEWWTLGLSATAWLLILYQHYGLSVAEVHHHAAASFALHSFIPEVFDWFLMVVATMVPVVIGGVRYAAGRSLWHRRHRSIGFFLAGLFLAVDDCRGRGIGGSGRIRHAWMGLSDLRYERSVRGRRHLATYPFQATGIAVLSSHHSPGSVWLSCGPRLHAVRLEGRRALRHELRSFDDGMHARGAQSRGDGTRRRHLVRRTLSASLESSALRHCSRSLRHDFLLRALN